MEELIILNSEDRKFLIRMAYKLLFENDIDSLFRIMEKVLTKEEDRRFIQIYSDTYRRIKVIDDEIRRAYFDRRIELEQEKEILIARLVERLSDLYNENCWVWERSENDENDKS